MNKLSEKSAVAYRVPVQVERELYNQFKEYSAVTGVPVARVVREALDIYCEAHKTFGVYSQLTGVPIARVLRDAISDYKETAIAAQLEAIQSKKKNVIAIDEFSPQAFAVGATASS